MKQEHRLTTLQSGVRIVTEAMPSVRSVSLGFWIGNGSRNESEDQAGLSHLLEHLLFKGTAKYQSLQIDQIFDGMGAELNAGTGKETTSVYARVIDVHVQDAFDVMADMVFRPSLSDIDSEREVSDIEFKTVMTSSGVAIMGMAEAMTPAEALRAAITNPLTLLKLKGQLGTVERGRLADLGYRVLTVRYDSEIEAQFLASQDVFGTGNRAANAALRFFVLAGWATRSACTRTTKAWCASLV